MNVRTMIIFALLLVVEAQDHGIQRCEPWSLVYNNHSLQCYEPQPSVGRWAQILLQTTEKSQQKIVDERPLYRRNSKFEVHNRAKSHITHNCH